MSAKRMLSSGCGPGSPLFENVRASVGQEAAENPSETPDRLMLHAGDFAQPYPGKRDALRLSHPTTARMLGMIKQYHPDASRSEMRRLLWPIKRADLVQACIYRYAALVGPDADLMRIYRDSNGSTVLDDNYAGDAYDADHCTSEQSMQAIDCSLVHYIKMMDQLRSNWPAMFRAVWRRDLKKVDALIERRPLPQLCCLRSQKGPTEKFRFMVGLFAEFERLFELLEYLGGPERVTSTSLKAALASLAKGQCAATGSREALYISTAWCHYQPLSHLSWFGCDDRLDYRHPHKAFGPRGITTAVSELDAIGTMAGHTGADGSFKAAVPFQLDSRLRPVGGDLPAHFFAGRDVRTMAIRFILELRQEMGRFAGGRANAKGKKTFELETWGAIGRLAMIITHRFCPETVAAVLDESSRSFQADRKALMPLGPTDLIANPRAWQRLYSGSLTKPSPTAARAIDLHGDTEKNSLLSNLVNTCRKDEHDFLSNCAGDIGHSVRFSALQWYTPYREAPALIKRWKNVPNGLKHAQSKLFSPIAEDRLRFCGRVAARMLPSALPSWQDPACRKSDARRKYEERRLQGQAK